MNYLNRAIIIVLGMALPPVAMASPDDDITIRMLDADEDATQAVTSQIELPEAASDEAREHAEDGLKAANRNRNRNRNAEDGESDLESEQQMDREQDREHEYAMEREREREMEREREREEIQEREMDRDDRSAVDEASREREANDRGGFGSGGNTSPGRN
jgi:hypothetical protein